MEGGHPVPLVWVQMRHCGAEKDLEHALRYRSKRALVTSTRGENGEESDAETAPEEFPTQ